MNTSVLWILLFTYIHPTTSDTEVLLPGMFFESQEKCYSTAARITKPEPIVPMTPFCIEGVLLLPTSK